MLYFYYPMCISMGQICPSTQFKFLTSTLHMLIGIMMGFIWIVLELAKLIHITSLDSDTSDEEEE